MSILTSASSESNRYLASAFASSVLPTPVGPAKINEPIGLFGFFQAGARTPDRFAQFFDSFFLSYDNFIQLFGHFQKFSGFALCDLVHRDARHHRNNIRHMFLRHLVNGGLRFQLPFTLCNFKIREEFLFEIAQSCGFFEILCLYDFIFLLLYFFNFVFKLDNLFRRDNVRKVNFSSRLHP